MSDDPAFPDPPCPSPDRAAWLLNPVSSVGRINIHVDQYEELRGLAIALKGEVETLKNLIKPLGYAQASVNFNDALDSLRRFADRL